MVIPKGFMIISTILDAIRCCFRLFGFFFQVVWEIGITMDYCKLASDLSLRTWPQWKRCSQHSKWSNHIKSISLQIAWNLRLEPKWRCWDHVPWCSRAGCRKRTGSPGHGGFGFMLICTERQKYCGQKEWERSGLLRGFAKLAMAGFYKTNCPETARSATSFEWPRSGRCGCWAKRWLRSLSLARQTNVNKQYLQFRISTNPENSYIRLYWFVE